MSVIQDYNNKPSFDPHGKSIYGIKSIGYYFGVELEVEVPDEDRLEMVAEKIQRILDNFAILKFDRSLEGKGFEICTSPATLSYHKENWDNFFEISGCTLIAAESKRCGMHVHISRAPLSDLQIGKMMAFIHNPNNRDFITHVSQRPSSMQNDFVTPRSIREAKPKYYQKFDRHAGINLLNHHTIEIRLFQGTIDRGDFFKNIEFCHALTKFTTPGRVSINDSLNYQILVDFIWENAKIYRNLASHLKKGNYQPCLA